MPDSSFLRGDAIGLAAAWKGLMLDAPRRADLGARGRARVLQHFTYRKITAEIVAAYREILGS